MLLRSKGIISLEEFVRFRALAATTIEQVIAEQKKEMEDALKEQYPNMWPLLNKLLNGDTNSCK